RSLPDGWPAALHPRVLAELSETTPYLAVHLDTVRDRYARLTATLPDARVHYAVKCNPNQAILQCLADEGCRFEVASIGELDLLRDIGVDPVDVLYSNTVKPTAHVAAAHKAGLWRFAVDCEAELRKIAQHAPGAAVYVRLRVDDHTASFPLSRKFGAEADVAKSLLVEARRLGLRPYGLTFHVGSQCASPRAWRSAIVTAGRLMQELTEQGIRLRMLDLGGGFPACYGPPVPPIEQYGTTIRGALETLLPYRPEHLVLEPGRHLVAEAAVLVTTVICREQRAGDEWLYLDVGVYNGLMETQQMQQAWTYPILTARESELSVPKLPYTVAGPSCDSADTMFIGMKLPADVDIDDQLYIGTAGAYTLGYASNFNGFPIPNVVIV
ncbi:MAG TPA: type III PLP-dependent enzyme, partial [Acidimicrobiales bacterium]|nr:type III PLP-dependent enzyme [Acidimicrobiales bacterium]